MKQYRYNADFFGEWYEESGIRQTELLEVIHATNINLKRWMTDKVKPLPIEKIIALCNHYDIDISNFFYEGNEKSDITPVKQSSIHSERAKPAHQEPEKTQSEEILLLKFNHLQELDKLKEELYQKEVAFKKEYQERKEQLVNFYEKRIAELNRMFDSAIETTKLALHNQTAKHQPFADNNNPSWEAGNLASDERPPHNQ